MMKKKLSKVINSEVSDVIGYTFALLMLAVMTFLAMIEAVFLLKDYSFAGILLALFILVFSFVLGYVLLDRLSLRRTREK